MAQQRIRHNQVDAGLGPNQIVKLDDLGRLPAVDGSLLTGVSGGGDVVSDLTPQLGGNLDLNSFNLFTVAVGSPASASTESFNFTGGNNSAGGGTFIAGGATIQGGTGSNGNDGGPIVINGGSSAGGGYGGYVSISSGSGTLTSGAGTISITGGNSSNNAFGGGAVSITSGDNLATSGAAPAGDIDLTAGDATTSVDGGGGSIGLYAGAGGDTGGDIILQPGIGTTGVDGSIQATGDIHIQKSSATLKLQNIANNEIAQFLILDNAGTLRGSFRFNDADDSIVLKRNSVGAVLETEMLLTNDGNVSVNGAAPTAIDHLTRKDYVDLRTEAVLYDFIQIGDQSANIGSAFPTLTSLNSTDVAHYDSGATNLRMMRFDFAGSPQTWSQVGDFLDLSGHGTGTLAGLNNTDVAFYDSTTNELQTYRFGGSPQTWSPFGEGLVIVGAARGSLARLNETDVAFVDDGNDEIRTYRFDAAGSPQTWSQVGDSLSIGVDYPYISALSSTDIVLSSNYNTLQTYRFDFAGSPQAWTTVGNSFALPDDPFRTAHAALNSTDIVYADDKSGAFRRYTFDGTDWIEDGIEFTIGVVAGALTSLNETDFVYTDFIADYLRTYRLNDYIGSIPFTDLLDDRYTDEEYVDTTLAAINIGDLNDVTNTAPSDKDILIYDGVTNNKYENRVLVEADISDLGTEIVTKTEIADATGNITLNGGNF